MEHFITLDSLKISGAIERATVAFFETTHHTIAFTDMKEGAEVPLHEDMQESIDIVLEGILEMEIDGTSGILTPGMISLIPARVPHKARAVSDCKVITVIHPKRAL
jgi:quercetin dioxygenase-like cupin family protein